MEIIKKVITQTSWQVIGMIIAKLCGVVLLSLIAKNIHYSETGIAIFTLATTYLALFDIAADLGLNGFILPFFNDQPHFANKIFNLRIYWGLILIILANVLIQFMPFRSPQLILAILVGSPMIITSGLFSSTNLIFQAKLKYEFSVLGICIDATAEVLLIFLLTMQLVPPGLLLFASTMAAVVGSYLSLNLAGRLYKFSLESPDLQFIKKTLKEAWPITATIFMNLLYFRADAFILSSIKSLNDVAIYNFAYQFFATALVLPTYIMNGFYPLMIKTFETSRSKFTSQIKLGLAVLFLISILGILATFLLSGLLISVIGGPRFEQSVVALHILSLSFPAFFLTSLLLWVMVILKRYISIVIIYSVGLLVNVILNLVFIPGYSFLAASWVTGVSEYLILMLQLVMVYRLLKKSD